MIRIEIPGRDPIELTHAVFDFNGTLAKDGVVSASVLDRLARIGQSLDVVVATADTFGTAAKTFGEANIALEIVSDGRDKERLVQQWPNAVAAVGNGANDVKMFLASALAICIVGPEGASAAAVQAADIVASSMESGLDLLLNPKRVVASLRP